MANLFFEVRGMAPRPLAIEVEYQDIDGTMRITTFVRGMARLMCHEVDHLNGVLYRARRRPGVEPALNQAVALVRFGTHVTTVGVVWDDATGRGILATLTAESIDVAGMQVRTGVATATSVYFLGDASETAFVWRIGDEVDVTPTTVQEVESAIRAADAVLITFEMPVASVREAIEAAVAPAPKSSSSPRPCCPRLLTP